MKNSRRRWMSARRSQKRIDSFCAADSNLAMRDDCVKRESGFFLRKLTKDRALHQTSIDRLIVFRALQIGDMLCAVPALRALRHALPRAHITLAGLPWAKQFARRFNHYIDDFISFPGHPELPEQAAMEAQLATFYKTVQDRQFDFALQMHGDGRVSNKLVASFNAKRYAGYRLHGSDRANECGDLFIDYPHDLPESLCWLRLMESLGAPAIGTELEFPITMEDEQELHASGLCEGFAHRNYICVHPGARNRSKCWPPPLFAAVADRLAEESGADIVLTGSSKEIDLTTAVAQHMRHKPLNAAAPISIGAMAALMRGARLLICNDTGVSHIAAGLHLPSVVVFSNSDMRRWAPLDGELHRCVPDPHGTQTAAVLGQARELLAKTIAPINMRGTIPLPFPSPHPR